MCASCLVGNGDARGAAVVDPRPIAVICNSGQRAAVGASLIQRFGAREVFHVVDGGVGTWVRRGRPVVR